MFTKLTTKYAIYNICYMSPQNKKNPIIEITC